MTRETRNDQRDTLLFIFNNHDTCAGRNPFPPTAPLSSQTLGLTLFRLLNHPKNMERLEFLQIGAPPPQRKRDSTLVQGIKHLPTFQELKPLGTG